MSRPNTGATKDRRTISKNQAWNSNTIDIIKNINKRHLQTHWKKLRKQHIFINVMNLFLIRTNLIHPSHRMCPDLFFKSFIKSKLRQKIIQRKKIIKIGIKNWRSYGVIHNTKRNQSN